MLLRNRRGQGLARDGVAYVLRKCVEQAAGNITPTCCGMVPTFRLLSREVEVPEDEDRTLERLAGQFLPVEAGKALDRVPSASVKNLGFLPRFRRGAEEWAGSRLTGVRRVLAHEMGSRAAGAHRGW